MRVLAPSSRSNHAVSARGRVRRAAHGAAPMERVEWVTEPKRFRALFPYERFRKVDPDDPSDTERVVTELLSDLSDVDERRTLAAHVRTAHTWKTRWRQIAERCLLPV
jgi:hypothetical protein